MLSRVTLLSLFIVYGVSGKHDGGKHEGGKKHGSYGVGYVEEGGVVGYSCHDGFVPQGEGPGMLCIHKEKMGLLPVCPVGILEGEKCLLREPAIFGCPPGFVEVGGYDSKKSKHGHGGHGGHGGKKHGGGGPLCMKIDRIQFDYYCANGTIAQGGQCVRNEIAPATMICPLDQYGGKKHGHGGHGGHGGKKHEGGKKHGYIQPACIETIDVPPILTCPPNLKLHGNSCVGVGEGPCPQPMPAPLILDHGKKHKHRGLAEEDDNLSESETDATTRGEESDDTESDSENIVLGEGEASAEGEASDSRAALDVPSEAARALGEKKHGHDYGMPILPPVPSKVKMCTLEVIEPAIPACPPGSIEMGLGGGHHEKKKHGGYGGGLMCTQTVDVPLQPYCPMSGAILNPETMTCESRIFEPELTRCPLGFEPCDLGGKKHGHGHGGKKEKHGGAGYGAGGCCAVQYADPLPSCPLGATLLGAQCVIKTHPIFECPPGAIQDGEFCYVIQTKPPKVHYQINVTTKQAPPIIETHHHKKNKKHH